MSGGPRANASRRIAGAQGRSGATKQTPSLPPQAQLAARCAFAGPSPLSFTVVSCSHAPLSPNPYCKTSAAPCLRARRLTQGLGQIESWAKPGGPGGAWTDAPELLSPPTARSPGNAQTYGGGGTPGGAQKRVYTNETIL
jgi:hypothetical protein